MTHFVCTKYNPWSEDKPTPVIHPDAKEVGEQHDDWYSGVSYQKMMCPHCGHHWTKELPQ